MHLSKIGGIVSTEIHGMCSWEGETVMVWGEFNEDVKDVPLGLLRKHLIKVTDINEPRPDKAIRITAFIQGKHLS